jgi:hypothetical protein
MAYRVQKPARLIKETHEPELLVNWPNGHAAVTLTGADQAECIEVTIHGVRHYLHSTTARALDLMLFERIAEWNETAAAGFPTV